MKIIALPLIFTRKNAYKSFDLGVIYKFSKIDSLNVVTNLCKGSVFT